MKTLSKRLKKQQVYCNELQKENEKLKRDVGLLEHLVQQQMLIEQNARKENELIRATLEETQCFMIYTTKKALEKDEVLEIALEDIRNISQEDIDIQIQQDEQGKITKMRLKLR